MKRTLSLKDFSILLIITLANDYEITDYKNNKIAVLPVDYKQRIENILCANNGWKEIFLLLIDIEKYFDNHFIWEYQLALEIKNVLEQMGKNIEYNFVSDSINISFSQKEIDLILSKYKDNSIRGLMNHFVALISDNIYTREFQEQFYDYNSRSVQYIKNRR